MKKLIAVVIVSMFAVGAAFAGPGSPSKTATAIKDVYKCPITGSKVVGAGGGSEVVGKYRVHFCCGTCKPQFDKLSDKQKAAKVAALVKSTPGKPAACKMP